MVKGLLELGYKIKTNNKPNNARATNLTVEEVFCLGISSCCSASNQISLPTVRI